MTNTMPILQRINLTASLLVCLAGPGFAQDVYTVQTRVKNADISPTLWGLFFEDINRAADGGVYAEMVEN